MSHDDKRVSGAMRSTKKLVFSIRAPQSDFCVCGVRWVPRAYLSFTTSTCHLLFFEGLASEKQTSDIMYRTRTYTNAAACSPDPDPDISHLTVEFKLVGNDIFTNGGIA